MTKAFTLWFIQCPNCFTEQEIKYIDLDYISYKETLYHSCDKCEHRFPYSKG